MKPSTVLNIIAACSTVSLIAIFVVIGATAYASHRLQERVACIDEAISKDEIPDCPEPDFVERIVNRLAPLYRSSSRQSRKE